MHRAGAFLFFLIALLAPSLASAEERINSFHSDLAIAKDGSVTITETIRIQVENDTIRHGILRDLPTRYEGRAGSTVKLGFDLLGVERNGSPEDVREERMANGVRLRIGSADRIVPRGQHTYTIRYRANRALGRFDEFDELYWNVTGNGWTFPIDQASATIRLPEPADFTQSAVYTGYQGSTDRNARISEGTPGTLNFRTTQPLRRYEGLTVAAAFPKGVVDPLTEAQKTARKLADWAPPIGAVLGLLLVIGYYIFAWLRVGRDPPPGTIVPLFSPPDDMSPAAIRYVVKRKMDNRGFAAAMVDAGIKGHVRLIEGASGFFKSGKTRIERQESDTPIGVGERAMLSRLVMVGDTIEMDNEHHAKFSAARKALTQPYKKQFDGVAFERNIGWAMAGLVILLAALLIPAVAVLWSEDAINPGQALVAVSGLSIGTLLFMALPDRGAGLRIPIMLLAIVAANVGAFAALPFIPQALATGQVWPVMLPLFIGLVVVITGFFWMSAPTLQGRALLDRIAGFKRYLSATEKERFDRMQPPREDLQLFERYLPYAIALGVENRWADRFEDRLAAAAQDVQRDDRGFHWYSGSRNVWDNPGRFATAVGGTLASSIASASTAPGSSSGSGGGGSSGGGGGGGGGSGW